jgi:PEP-CTERM motif
LGEFVVKKLAGMSILGLLMGALAPLHDGMALAQPIELDVDVTGSVYTVPGEPVAGQPVTKLPVTTMSSPSYVQSSGSVSEKTHVPGDAYSEGAFVTAWAAAEAGSVHARASVGAAETTPSVLMGDGLAYIPDSSSTGAVVTSGAEFYDHVTLSSAILPIGTPVSFNVNFYADGSYQGDLYPLNFTFGYTFAGVSYACEAPNLGCAGVDALPGRIDNTYGGVFSAKIGDTVEIGAFVGIGGAALVDAADLAEAGPNWSERAQKSSTIDMSNTAGVWIGPISDDVTFTSASGFDYAIDPLTTTPVGVTGVPEASTWAMMLLGFAGLGYAGYRRQRVMKSSKRTLQRSKLPKAAIAAITGVVALSSVCFSSARAAVTYSGSFDPIQIGTSDDLQTLSVSFSWTQTNFLSANTLVTTFTSCGGNDGFICEGGLQVTATTFGGEAAEQLSLSLFQPVRGDLTLTTYFDPSAITADGDYRSVGGRGASLDVTGAGPISAAAPEPSTWAMMLIGFAGLGGAMLRRARRGAATT